MTMAAVFDIKILLLWYETNPTEKTYFFDVHSSWPAAECLKAETYFCNHEEFFGFASYLYFED